MSEKFTITPAGANTPVVVLGDDAITAPHNSISAPPLPDAEIQLQVAMPVRAARARVFARGNALVNYSWTVIRTHATQAEAETFRREHVRAVLRDCALGQFVLVRQSFGVTMRSTGALANVRCNEWLGVRTVTSYSWRGTPFET
jgi:hypothetical protein